MISTAARVKLECRAAAAVQYEWLFVHLCLHRHRDGLLSLGPWGCCRGLSRRQHPADFMPRHSGSAIPGPAFEGASPTGGHPGAFDHSALAIHPRTGSATMDCRICVVATTPIMRR
jgi:hypothetical protein